MAGRLLVDHCGPADRGVHHDIELPELGRRRVEQALDVERVADVRANRDRRAVGGEDAVDDGFGFPLVAEKDHHDGEAAARKLPRELAAGPA